MKLTPVQCKDGSWTLHNDRVDECYHAPAGAHLEAVEKFVKPCDFKSMIFEHRKEGKPIRILDVCFGMGYNSAAALELIRKIDKDIDVEIVGLELSPDIIRQIFSVRFPFSNEDIFRSLIGNFDKENDEFLFRDDNTSIKIMIDDARKSVTRGLGSFDAVFFDAFSPGKAPHLWTKEFFHDIWKVCNDGAILTTYSCARKVRENLQEAGFEVRDGPIVGRRGPATIAVCKKHL